MPVCTRAWPAVREEGSFHPLGCLLPPHKEARPVAPLLWGLVKEYTHFRAPTKGQLEVALTSCPFVHEMVCNSPNDTEGTNCADRVLKIIFGK